MHVDVAVQAMFCGDAMHLPALFQGLRVGTCLEEGGESVVVGEDAQIEHLGEEQQGLKWGVGASVAAGHGVEEDHV